MNKLEREERRLNPAYGRNLNDLVKARAKRRILPCITDRDDLFKINWLDEIIDRLFAELADADAEVAAKRAHPHVQQVALANLDTAIALQRRAKTHLFGTLNWWHVDEDEPLPGAQMTVGAVDEYYENPSAGIEIALREHEIRLMAREMEWEAERGDAGDEDELLPWQRYTDEDYEALAEEDALYED